MSLDLKFPGGVRELVLGDSFKDNSDNNSFCTIKYDFKPETEALGETAKIDITNSDQVTVTHSNTVEKDDVSQVQYKGSLRPYEKECVLIIDHKTGEIRLEKLSSNIQLKRSRIVKNPKHQKHHRQKHSKPKEETNGESSSKNSIGSSPLVLSNETVSSTVYKREKSFSGSSDNSSDSESDSSSDVCNDVKKSDETHAQSNGYQNGSVSFTKGHILDEDLRLSESGSDSD